MRVVIHVQRPENTIPRFGGLIMTKTWELFGSLMITITPFSRHATSKNLNKLLDRRPGLDDVQALAVYIDLSSYLRNRIARQMNKIKEAAATYLEQALPKTWVEAWFPGRRYGHDTSNIVESVNKTL
jgi:hypothetical protein